MIQIITKRDEPSTVQVAGRGTVPRWSDALEGHAQESLTSDLLKLIEQFNRSGDDTMVVPSTYLEIVITRQ